MLTCETCEETFANLGLLHTHMKSQHLALQHHVSTEHAAEQGRTFLCGDCTQHFNSQQALEEHQRNEHSSILFTEAQEAAQMVNVQVVQTTEQLATTEQVVTLEEAQLSGVGPQLFVSLPDSHKHFVGSHEIVALNVEELLDGTVTLIWGDSQ
uniref:C2H2-type domain-containing protein n=2 Tax=Callorhinchus milii TaxID=7868 RepID=A0A4W3HI71_CALMI